LFLIALLAACTSTPGPTPEPFDATGDWVLESGSVNGAPIPVLADYPITLSVDGTEVGGQSACNFYGGRLEVVNGQVRLAQTSSTAMACGEPDSDVMQSEAAFVQALGEIRAARGETDRLTLFGPTAELIFTRRAPIPIVDIVATDWVLESVIDDHVAAAAIGEPATLRFEENGTFQGSTGCRTFSGTWVKARGQLVATQMSMEGVCPGGLGGQDGAVAEGVGGSFAKVEGDRLTLAKNGGAALVYRRATD